MDESLDERLAGWEARLDRLEDEPEGKPESAQADKHLLFVPSPTGYALVERAGDPPAPGDKVELDERASFAVARVARSPLPGDGRRLAYLEAI